MISELFIESVNQALEKDEVSNTQKQAVITLIEKKDHYRTFLESWRPILLLNIEAKIMSRVTATRMKAVMRSMTCDPRGLGLVITGCNRSRKKSYCAPRSVKQFHHYHSGLGF